MTTNDATLAELNEQNKDKPVSEAIYEIDGQIFTVTSHYVGEKFPARSFIKWLLKEPMQKPLDKSEKRTCHIRFSVL